MKKCAPLEEARLARVLPPLVTRWPHNTPRAPHFQRHHLIPVGLSRRPQFREFFQFIALRGFSLNTFNRNGILLPGRALDARRTGLALHRGPHFGYDVVVASRLERIRGAMMRMRVLRPIGAIIEAIWRVGLLQKALRRTRDGTASRWVWLNRRDPMRIYSDTSALDRQIYALFPD